MVPVDLDDLEIPDWRGVPEPVAVITMSWEDVYVEMCRTLDRKPSRDEVETLFTYMANHLGDALMESYWAALSDLIAIDARDDYKSP